MTQNRLTQITPYADDLKLVKQRYIDLLLQPQASVATTGQYYRYPEQLLEPIQELDSVHVQSSADSLTPAGAWPDIDYEKGFSATAELTPVTHLARLLRLARVGRAKHDPVVRRAALTALGFWLEHDFMEADWWWLRLGTQKWLFRTCLLLADDLTAAQSEKMFEILARASEHPFTTGQNLVWSAEIAAVAAILAGDGQQARTHYRRIANEIRATFAEGIQPDMSFHQHGPCLYSHGYGKSFAADCSRIAGLVAGTHFAFPQAKVDLLASYILDGQQWLTRGAYVDYGAVGRRTGRRNQTARHQHDIAHKMLKLPTGREDEFRTLAERALGHDAPPLVGNRHFWCSDMMVHHQVSYYASARMHSTRVLNTDRPYGGTGRLNHHIADGCNFICRRGDEYVDITPVWDWQKIPGTTVEQTWPPNADPVSAGELNGVALGRKGERAFVGGVSDGMYGLAAYDFARRTCEPPQQINLTARKAWFFFNSEIVCLGAGITGRGSHPVTSTINQCHLRGTVTVSPQGQLPEHLQAGKHVIKNASWIHHDEIAYVFPKPTTIHLSTTAQSGSWQRVNAGDSDAEITLDVFKLWINHGIQPAADVYSYVVLPDLSREKVAEVATSLPLKILSNTPLLQAVRHTTLRLTQMAFYATGELAVAPDLTVGVDAPCLLLLKQDDNGMRLAMAHPARRRHSVTVRINRELHGEGATLVGKAITHITFDLPGALAAGSSVVRDFHYSTLTPSQ